MYFSEEEDENSNGACLCTVQVQKAESRAHRVRERRGLQLNCRAAAGVLAARTAIAFAWGAHKLALAFAGTQPGSTIEATVSLMDCSRAW